MVPNSVPIGKIRHTLPTIPYLPCLMDSTENNPCFSESAPLSLIKNSNLGSWLRRDRPGVEPGLTMLCARLIVCVLTEDAIIGLGNFR